MRTNFLYQWCWYPPKSFFKWGIISNFNQIFSWMGTAKFTGLQWEDVMYLPKRDLVEATRLGDQDSNPLRSNSSNNFSCLCFTVSLGDWWLWTPSDTSVKPVCIGCSGTMWLWLPLPLGSSSSESGDMPYYSSPPQQHSYCHCTILYKCFVPSGPGVRIHPQPIEPESSHWFPLQCEQSLSLHV